MRTDDGAFRAAEYMISVTTSRPNIDSPLRYPGGKSSLARFLGTCVEAMDTDAATYVEPYAGGAGSAATLLLANKVDRIVINDLDPAVHSFWRAVLEEGPALTKWVREVELSLTEWDRQREVYKAGLSGEWFELAKAFFYLNRTNRSGVLNAGVIGGRAQDGTYRIGARFNRSQLADRIDALSSRKRDIDLRSVDGRKLIEEFAPESDVLIYADPPYVKMGGSLYLNAFSELDHTLLSNCLHRNRSAWWFLTYDDASLVRALYSDLTLGEYSLHWSARNQGIATELFVMSDALATAMTA